MRVTRARFAALIIMPVLVAAGCGGSTVTVQEVPGDPAPIEVPGTGAALAPASSEATSTPTPTPTEEADTASESATPDTGAATEQAPTETAPDGTAEGGTEAPAPEDNATNDQAPPPGSDAEQFEDFCANNPGAC